MFNPIIKHKKYLVIYISVWILIILIHTGILHFFYHINYEQAFVDAFIFNGLFAVTGINLWYVIRFSRSGYSSKYNLFISHLLIATITIGLWLSISFFILQAIFDNNIYLDFLRISLPWRAITGIMFYSVFVLLYYVILYYEDLQEKIRIEEKLNTLIKEAELNALKSQINPHFLFNSLNSVSSLTITNPSKAQEMIIKLSDFLRYSLGNDKNENASIEQELDNMQRYLDIEKIRFGKRLKYISNVPESCLKIKIPNMILQPLIENTIKHGVYTSTEEIVVKLECISEENYLLIKIINDYDNNAVIQKGEGIGLKNIKHRLQLIYHRDDLLKINNNKKQFEVLIKFPKIK